MANYRGTGITGTSTTPKIFPNSGVANAGVGQIYLNTSTGHVYYCTDGGTADKAKWAYGSTDIIKAPTVKVSGLSAPKRDGATLKWKTGWKVPKSLTDSKRCDRATGLRVTWKVVYQTYPETKKHTITVVKNVNTSTTSATLNLASMKDTKGRTWGRSSFYPSTQKVVSSITVEVESRNAKGGGKKATASASASIKAPGKPTVSAPTIDANGQVTWRITPAADSGNSERAKTFWGWERYDNSSGEWSFRSSDFGENSGNSQFTVTKDATDWQVSGRVIGMRLMAVSMGLGYENAVGFKSIYISRPKTPSIKNVKYPAKITATGLCSVDVNTNQDTRHPVDGVVLQKLVDTTAATAAEATAASGWTDTDVKDDGECKALGFIIGTGASDGVMPQAGLRTWIRVRTWNKFDVDAFQSFSAPIELSKLYRNASDDAIRLVLSEAKGEGVSRVVFGWNQTQATSTEVSWSSDQNAWKSVDGPTTYETTRDDGAVTIGGTSYSHSLELFITGLEPDADYWVRARRFSDTEPRVYSQYSSAAKLPHGGTVESVTLTGPSSVNPGKGAKVSWTFTGTGRQKSAWVYLWRSTPSPGRWHIVPVEIGSQQSCTIPEMWVTLGAAYNNGVARVRVHVYSDGGVDVYSNEIEIPVAKTPTLGIGTLSLTAQPLSIPLTCDVPTCDVAITVESMGSAGDDAILSPPVPEGDVVFTGIFSPEWSGGEATVELPPGLGFSDKATYRVIAVATDRNSGVSSDAASKTVDVDWAHQAPNPANISIEADVETAEDGFVARYAELTLNAPDGYGEGGQYEQWKDTDSYDVFRLTGDGPALIASGMPFGSVIRDDFAPYGDDMSYRVCLRTADGDTAWDDFRYSLAGNGLRFDFDGTAFRHVELPWNLSLSDSYSKDTQIDRMMDGSMAAHWNSGAERSGSYSADVILRKESRTVDAVRDLARTTGPVFVRTPLGTAFEADVQVSEMGVEFKSGMFLAVSFDCKEIDLTQRHMAVLLNPEEDPEEVQP